MAEFCLTCWNELNQTNLTEQDVRISKDPDLCEGCASWQPVVESYRGGLSRLLKMLFPKIFH